MNTYGQALRSTDPSKLTRREREWLESERAWDAANPALVKALDALVGKYVRLRENHPSYEVDVPAEELRGRTPIRYRSDVVYLIKYRAREYLVGDPVAGELLQLRIEWVRPLSEEEVNAYQTRKHRVPRR